MPDRPTTMYTGTYSTQKQRTQDDKRTQEPQYNTAPAPSGYEGQYEQTFEYGGQYDQGYGYGEQGYTQSDGYSTQPQGYSAQQGYGERPAPGYSPARSYAHESQREDWE